MEVAPCNTKSCWTMEEVCAWSDWGVYGECSKSCNSGQQTRVRQKSWHAPDAAKALGFSRRLMEGSACEGQQKEIRPCSVTPCSLASAPVNCQWEKWSQWGDCACSGLSTRQRMVAMQASRNGVPCVGALEDSQSCKPSLSCTSLDVNCAFGLWTPWSACSVTCGSGQRYHTRTVITHAQAGGQRCHGGLEEVEACHLAPCSSAQDCSYTNWGSWGSCSRDCGGGQRERSRAMARPAKQGGAPCPEADLAETGVCNMHDCVEDAWGKIDCTWSQWSSWGSCSASCGSGQAQRSRIIVQEVAHGGQTCTGLFQDFRNCTAAPCVQRDCSFSAWSAWSACSDKCTGHVQRVRSVESVAVGGAACRGSTVELQPCGDRHDVFCLSSGDAVDCKFSAWSSWSACSRECGGGQHISTRKVAQYPGGAGEPCSGALKRLDACRLVYCPGDEPVDCKLGDWGYWRPCSASCGGGEMQRNRPVLQEPRNGGTPCAESFISQVKPCNTEPCSSDICTWTHWTAWGTCSASCGAGEMRRHRALFRADFSSLEAAEQLQPSLLSLAATPHLVLLAVLSLLALLWHIFPRRRGREASYMPLNTEEELESA
ncbi:unnamed protein product [Effrenium voratum]|nr:unnamed protein product [Effrenium voratum]